MITHIDNTATCSDRGTTGTMATQAWGYKASYSNHEQPALSVMVCIVEVAYRNQK